MYGIFKIHKRNKELLTTKIEIRKLHREGDLLDAVLDFYQLKNKIIMMRLSYHLFVFLRKLNRSYGETM